MRNKMKSLAAALAVMFVGWTGTAMAEGPVVVRFSHVVKADTPKGRAADKFKELTEAYSKGKIKVEVYPNSTLYNDAGEMRAVVNGDVEIIAPSFSKMTAMGINEFQALDTPFLFDKDSDVPFILDGPVGQNLLKLMEEKDLIGLAFWDNGFKQMHSNRSMRTPSDMQGLRVRVQPSKVLEEQMRSTGAVPRSMSFSEVFPALTNNILDGSENPVSNFYTQNMHLVQKHLTMTNHGYLGYIVAVNKNWWNGLSEGDREVLQRAMKESTDFERSIAKEDNDVALQKVRESRKTWIATLSAGERDLWKNAFKDSYKALDPASQKVVEDIRNRLKENSSHPEKK